MSTRDSELWATIVVANTRQPADLARWLLSTVPSHSLPRYFAPGEILRRRSGFEIANTEAFEHYLATRCSHWFHSNEFLIWSGLSFHGRQEIELYARSIPEASRLLHDWIPALDKQGLYWVHACTHEEEDHRNGISLSLLENPQKKGHIWVGRDYERYVPGLYWLNYFSREFAALHGIHLERLSEGLQAEVSELENGWLVKLYESPKQWAGFKDPVDEFLFSTPGFFSKRRVTAPDKISFRDTPELISRLGREWP